MMKGKILDVGGGHNPRLNADTVVDISTSFKGETHDIPQDTNFVLEDAEKLPFRDNEFDFVFALHLIEHLEYPEKGLNRANQFSLNKCAKQTIKLYKTLKSKS